MISQVDPRSLAELVRALDAVRTPARVPSPCGMSRFTSFPSSLACPSSRVKISHQPWKDPRSSRPGKPQRRAPKPAAAASAAPAGVAAVRKSARASRKPTPVYFPPVPPAATLRHGALRNPSPGVATRKSLRTQSKTSPSYRVGDFFLFFPSPPSLLLDFDLLLMRDKKSRRSVIRLLRMGPQACLPA